MATRCDDADILVIMLVHIVNYNIHIWLDVGENYNNIGYDKQIS